LDVAAASRTIWLVSTINFFDPIEKIVHALRPFPEARNDLVQICQQLAELGFPAAGTLRNLILGDTQEGGPHSPID
jgi:hypothetical protein